MIIAEGASWLIVVAIVAVVYGGVSFYRMGARWERRWDDLIREKFGDRE